ncbi:hypothetical protein A0H81_09155 [Grifola frondosa]|uniref:Organic hydroperoxide resistance protein n=1 Tax=Grifola frondosa TaxID=5627 RepID=A0A1C7M280_GRIFR|nr:hypothetical protein A0H81_09155 [Grifola frondosa]
MHTSRVLLRPLSQRIMIGSGVRHARLISPSTVYKRGILTLKDHVATAQGAGRNGTVRSNGDAPLELKMSMPKVTGGKGDGQNPEQLFAMGYSSCFLGALQLAASRANKKELAENAKVSASVFLGHPSDPSLDGFGLRVDITVEGCNDDQIIAAAHEVSVILVIRARMW